MKQVLRDVIEKGVAYMRPRILAGSTGPGMLRAYIESNLAFIRENRKDVIAVLDIARSAEGRHLFKGDSDVVDAVRALEALLSGFQTAGQLRPDFDPRVMAIAIRAAIDAVPSRLARDPEFDIDNYASEIVTVFDLATTSGPDMAPDRAHPVPDGGTDHPSQAAGPPHSSGPVSSEATASSPSACYAEAG